MEVKTGLLAAEYIADLPPAPRPPQCEISLMVKRFYNIKSSDNQSTTDTTDTPTLEVSVEPTPFDDIELPILDGYEDIDWLTQHRSTSPPIKNTHLRPKSTFNPTH